MSLISSTKKYFSFFVNHVKYIKDDFVNHFKLLRTKEEEKKLIKTLVYGAGVACAIKLAMFLGSEILGKVTESSLKDKIIVITGAGSGIGRLLSLKTASQGATVILLDINKEAVEKVRKEIVVANGSAFSDVCDVTNQEDVQRVAKNILETHGKVDVLVNNAGIVLQEGDVDKLDINKARKVMEVNAISHLCMLGAYLPIMKEKNNGHIVTIASASSLSGIPLMADYCASKWAAAAIHEATRIETQILNGKSGVNFTVVNPYFIKTGMFEGVNTPWHTQMLDPDYVVNRIVRSIKRKETELTLPDYLAVIIPYMRYKYGSKIRDNFAYYTGFTTGMRGFKGSHPNKK